MRHPLLPALFTSSMVPIKRRPRFTTGEAVVLNALVNAAPEYVSIRELQRRLDPFAAYLVTRSTIQRLVNSLRAKLGDTKNRPEIIVSVRDQDYDTRWVAGYVWKGD